MTADVLEQQDIVKDLSSVACSAALEIDTVINSKKSNKSLDNAEFVNTQKLVDMLGDDLDASVEINLQGIQFQYFVNPDAVTVDQALADIRTNSNSPNSGSDTASQAREIISTLQNITGRSELEKLIFLKKFCLALAKRATKKTYSVDDILDNNDRVFQ